MPDVGRDGDRIALAHLCILVFAGGVTDAAFDYHEDLAAIGMIVLGIASARFEDAAARRHVL